MLQEPIIDSPPDLLELANQALAENNFPQASAHFEQYANNLMNLDHLKAAFYFSMAAQCEKVNHSRALSLYQKLFKIYKQKGKVEESAKILMEMGLVYLELGKADVARKEFKIGMALYLEIVRDQIHCLGGPLTQSQHDYLVAILDKVKFCLDELYHKDSQSP